MNEYLVKYFDYDEPCEAIVVGANRVAALLEFCDIYGDKEDGIDVVGVYRLEV